MADITQGTSDEILFLSSGRPVRDIIELKLDDPSVTCLGSATTTGRQCCPPNQSALDEVALILYDAEESGHILKSQLNDLARLVLCKRINSSLRQTLVDSWAQDIQLDNEASISACPAKVAHGNRAHSIAVPGSHAGVVNLRNHEAANTQAQRHRNALEEKYLIHRLIFLNLNPGSPRSRAMPSCIRQHPYEQLIRMPAVPTCYWASSSESCRCGVSHAFIYGHSWGTRISGCDVLTNSRASTHITSDAAIDRSCKLPGPLGSGPRSLRRPANNGGNSSIRFRPPALRTSCEIRSGTVRKSPFCPRIICTVRKGLQRRSKASSV